MSSRNLPVLVVLGLCACEGLDGDRAAAHGEARFRGEDFEIAYVSPPWTVDESNRARLRLQIEAALFGVTFNASAPSHVFRFEHVSSDGDVEAAIFDIAGDTTAGIDVEDWVPQTPEDLTGVDLTDARAVAFAELDFLLHERNAELQTPVASFVTNEGESAVVFGVLVAPALFLRAYYFATGGTVVRAEFVSIFDLDSSDIDEMAASVSTQPAPETAR